MKEKEVLINLYDEVNDERVIYDKYGDFLLDLKETFRQAKENKTKFTITISEG